MCWNFEVFKSLKRETTTLLVSPNIRSVGLISHMYRHGLGHFALWYNWYKNQVHLICESWEDSCSSDRSYPCGHVYTWGSELFCSFCHAESSTREMNYYLENFVFSEIIKIQLPNVICYGDSSDQEPSKGRDCIPFMYLQGLLLSVAHC